MEKQPDPAVICAKIQTMKGVAEELQEMGEPIPAIARNMVRILASIRMLEINMCDLVEPGPPQ
jgi:hypothetical protein